MGTELSYAKISDEENGEGKKRSLCNKIGGTLANFLRELSLGKYEQGLYLKGRREESTITGGILTILAIFGFLFYSILLINFVI